MNSSQKFAALSVEDKQKVMAACKKQNTSPDSLLDFGVSPNRIVIILGNGEKYVYSDADLAGYFQRPVVEAVEVMDGESVKPVAKPRHTRKV